MIDPMKFAPPCLNNLDAHTQDGASVRRVHITNTSTSHNVRVEKAFARPCFDKMRTVLISGIGTSDVIPPAADKHWNGEGYSGLSGYIQNVDVGDAILPTATVDLELWAYDKQNSNWFLVETKAAVLSNTQVRFEEAVRWRTVFVRVQNPQNSPINTKLFFTWE